MITRWSGSKGGGAGRLTGEGWEGEGGKKERKKGRKNNNNENMKNKLMSWDFRNGAHDGLGTSIQRIADQSF